MRPIPELTIDFLKRHEGLVLRVYDDARPRAILRPGMTAAGVLTAGYGHTGPDLRAGAAVTAHQAEAWLREDLETAGQLLLRRIGGIVGELTEHQYAALLSFVFNLGAGASWTIWKRLRARQFDQVPLEMMRFVNARGRKLQGLVKRRAAEVALWSTAEPGTADEYPSSGTTRAIATPPTSTDPTPAARSGSILAAISGVVAGTPVAIQQLNAVTAPYLVQSPLVQRASAFLATVAALAAVTLLVMTWLQKRAAGR